MTSFGQCKKDFLLDKAFFTYDFPSLLSYISPTQDKVWFSNIDQFGKACVLNLFILYDAISVCLCVPSVKFLTEWNGGGDS